MTARGVQPWRIIRPALYSCEMRRHLPKDRGVGVTRHLPKDGGGMVTWNWGGRGNEFKIRAWRNQAGPMREREREREREVYEKARELRYSMSKEAARGASSRIHWSRSGPARWRRGSEARRRGTCWRGVTRLCMRRVRLVSFSSLSLSLPLYAEVTSLTTSSLPGLGLS